MFKKEIKIKPVAEPARPELVFRANIPLDIFQRNIGGKSKPEEHLQRV